MATNHLKTGVDSSPETCIKYTTNSVRHNVGNVAYSSPRMAFMNI